MKRLIAALFAVFGIIGTSQAYAQEAGPAIGIVQLSIIPGGGVFCFMNGRANKKAASATMMSRMRRSSHSRMRCHLVVSAMASCTKRRVPSSNCFNFRLRRKWIASGMLRAPSAPRNAG